MTGPAKIGHVGSQNLTTFQTFGSHNFLFKYGIATKISELVDNLFGFSLLLTESKCYISALRYVLSNDMVYFSPHALFSQAQSQITLMGKFCSLNTGSKKQLEILFLLIHGSNKLKIL